MFRNPRSLCGSLRAHHRPLLIGLGDPVVPGPSERTCSRWSVVRANSTCWRDEGRTVGGKEGREEKNSPLGKTATPRSSSSSSSSPNSVGCPLSTSSQHPTPKDAHFNCAAQLPQEYISVKQTMQPDAWLIFSSRKLNICAHIKSSPSRTCSSFSNYQDCSNDTKCLFPHRSLSDQSNLSPVTTPGSAAGLGSQSRRSGAFNRRSSFQSAASLYQPKPWSLSDLQGTHPLVSVPSPQTRAVHRAASLYQPKPWSLSDLRGTHPLVAVPSPQTRAVHRAAPREAVAPHAVLSLENEERCRRSLNANARSYDQAGTRVWGAGLGRRPGGWASVLVSLCSVEAEPAFLFTLRSSALKGRHKGDVCFAGGKRDPSDKDVVDTALREAREELGITVATESVWGVLTPIKDMSGMVVAPVLANIGPLEALSFKPNPGEVEEIFTLSLSHLCSPLNRGYTHFRIGDRYGYTLPVFRNGKHRVWGLTAVALDHTLKLLLSS